MTLGWFGIFRLGLVQMSLGGMVVLTTSTLNRLMVVELALPAVLAGVLVALHYAVQITRPSWGYRSDTCGNRTRWIVGGMAALALGAFSAAVGVVTMESAFWPGLVLSFLAYLLIGLGAGAGGTSLLALMATCTRPERRAAAATITWLMMIFGIAATAGTVGALLEPYSPRLLLEIVGAVCLGGLALTVLATWRIERGLVAEAEPDAAPLLEGLREIWSEPRARSFTFFVFLSMTAYFMQELILEPYAGFVFGLTPGQSTSLSGAQNGGVFLGMLAVGIGSTGLRIGSLRSWVVAGCLGSALSLLAISLIGQMNLPLIVPAVVMMGVFNGMFAVSAIGSMMQLAGEGRHAREGTRMGLWGAAQAVAAGFGGLAGAGAADLLRLWTDIPTAFGLVFFFEAALFVISALMALRILEGGRAAPAGRLVPGE
ncbi:BCD family MFS transporter [Cereibacter sphaeroides]|uniref:BCD family MFS transporter n=1 Tax=Cereibacter sphaeroides TaxID=1063 RepID=UPI001F166699|nr:BCD family MFS transporter [Cereibacter sphaeroides]MCE6969379.1 BCD family MFS transporter [Cereibacter sphaeroides]